MHAPYVRVWFVSGLAALLLAIPAAFANAAATPFLLALGVSYLALAVALGILPAFARRDWPTPLYAIAAVGLAVIGLPFVLANERAFSALVGASLLVGAAQPLALLLSPRWTSAAEDRPHTDRPALAALVAALAAIGGAGLLLIALPRGLPNAGFALALCASAPLAAFGALLFLLARRAPVPGATLAWAFLALLLVGALGVAAAFAFPFGMDLRGPLAAMAAAFALAVVTMLRAPDRPRLLGSALAAAILATLALLLASIEASLFPVAFQAFVALGLIGLAAALTLGARILLPGRLRGERWMRWAPALLLAALFLYTPALQLGRSVVPAAIVGAFGLAILVWGLAPLAQTVKGAKRLPTKR